MRSGADFFVAASGVPSPVFTSFLDSLADDFPFADTLAGLGASFFCSPLWHLLPYLSYLP